MIKKIVSIVVLSTGLIVNSSIKGNSAFEYKYRVVLHAKKQF